MILLFWISIFHNEMWSWLSVFHCEMWRSTRAKILQDANKNITVNDRDLQKCCKSVKYRRTTFCIYIIAGILCNCTTLLSVGTESWLFISIHIALLKDAFKTVKKILRNVNDVMHSSGLTGCPVSINKAFLIYRLSYDRWIKLTLQSLAKGLKCSLYVRHTLSCSIPPPR